MRNEENAGATRRNGKEFWLRSADSNLLYYSQGRFVHPLGVLRRQTVAALRIEMEVDLVAGIHREERMRVDAQQVISNGDLTVIGIAHEDRLFNRAFENIVGHLRLLLDHLDMLRPDREHRGASHREPGGGNKRE